MQAINMASFFVSTAVALPLVLLLLTAAAVDDQKGSYDISAEKGWNKFVQDAANGTGGTPIDMDEFVTRVNNNINNGGGDDDDPALMEELKSFDDEKNPTAGKMKSGETKPSSQPAAAAMDDLDVAKMVASTNGGSLAPANAPMSGAFSVKAAGAVCGLLPAFAAYFVM